MFDFETNGINPDSSVLEAAFIKIKINLQTKEIEDSKILHRFYFPKQKEVFDYSAYSIHNISLDKIKKEREKQKYALYFNEDKDATSFIEDADIMVAHNIDFDYQFLPKNFYSEKICTMKGTKNIIKALNISGRIKNPTLKELSTFLNIPFEDTAAHGALYDTQILKKCFIEALKRNLIEDFIQLPHKDKFSILRTKNSTKQKYVKDDSFYIENYSFLLSDVGVLPSSKSFLRIYENKTGNLFMAFPEFMKKEILEDNVKFKYIEAEILDIIKKQNSVKKINNFVDKNGSSSQLNLFDFL